MHIRMDRMKTLRWLLVLVGVIYFVERGTEKVSELVTHSFAESTAFMKTMNEESAKDRERAEAFQQALDRHNGTRPFKFNKYNESKLVTVDNSTAKN
jgi:hypothetical protein